MIKLSLPPLPGTDTAHPAFAILTHDKIAVWQCVGDSFFQIKINGVIKPIAAAAIAHYWYEHSQSLKSCTSDWDFALNQYGYWSAIAAGSREYDGAEVVGYTPHEN